MSGYTTAYLCMYIFGSCFHLLSTLWNAVYLGLQLQVTCIAHLLACPVLPSQASQIKYCARRNLKLSKVLELMFRNGLDIPTLSKLTANTDSQQLQFEHKEASEPSHETVSNKVQERKFVDFIWKGNIICLLNSFFFLTKFHWNYAELFPIKDNAIVWEIHGFKSDTCICDFVKFFCDFFPVSGKADVKSATPKHWGISTSLSRNYALCRNAMIGTQNIGQRLCLNHATLYPVFREKSIYSGMSEIWVN